MICHECLMAGAAEHPASGLCRFCFVALCKDHLVELYRNAPTFPQYACRHAPGAPRQNISGRRVEVPRAAEEVVAPNRAAIPTGRLMPGLGNA